MAAVIDTSKAVKPVVDARTRAEIESHMSIVGFHVRETVDRTTAEYIYQRLMNEVRLLSRKHGFKLS